MPTYQSSPRHNFTEEDARLLHQVQATNAELNRVKSIKRREMYGSFGDTTLTTHNSDQLIKTEDGDARRVAIQIAARASYRRKQKQQKKDQRKPSNQKTTNRKNRARRNLRQPMRRDQSGRR